MRHCPLRVWRICCISDVRDVSRMYLIPVSFAISSRGMLS